MIDAALLARARRYASTLVGEGAAEDTLSEALLGYCHAQATGVQIWAPWPFLRKLIRRRAADRLEKDRVTPRPWERRRAYVTDDAGIRDYDPDHFYRPGGDPEEELIRHCDAPIVQRAVEKVAPPREQQLVRVWMRADTAPEAARQLGISLKRLHEGVSDAVIKARRVLGVECDTPVQVGRQKNAERRPIPEDVQHAIIVAGLSASGAQLAERFGISKQHVSAIRKAHGVVVPKRIARTNDNCPHADRPHASGGRCGSCANAYRASLRSVAVVDTTPQTCRDAAGSSTPARVLTFAPRAEPEFEAVWTGTLERQGRVAGLSHASCPSTLDQALSFEACPTRAA